MEEQNNNDVLGDVNAKDTNLKKYLIIGGGFFLLFVVGIVVAKFLYSPSKNDTNVILPPEIKTDKTVKQDTNLFNNIPVEENKKVQKDETQFKKPEVLSDTTTMDVKNDTVPSVEDSDVIDVTKPNETSEIKKTEESLKSSTEPVKQVEEKVIPIQKVEKKVEVEKPKPKKVVIKREYYIQVAAITRGEPSKKFLKLIKKNGFNYHIFEVSVNGLRVKRVLIGAYTKTEAKQHLAKVKRVISSSAFIKRVK